MGKLLRTDERYAVLHTLPKNNNGVVEFHNKHVRTTYTLTVLEFDKLLVKVLYTHYRNLLGERCVSFEQTLVP